MLSQVISLEAIYQFPVKTPKASFTGTSQKPVNRNWWLRQVQWVACWNYLDKSTQKCSTCRSGLYPHCVEFTEDRYQPSLVKCKATLSCWHTIIWKPVNSCGTSTAQLTSAHMWRKSSKKNCNRWGSSHRTLSTGAQRWQMGGKLQLLKSQIKD